MSPKLRFQMSKPEVDAFNSMVASLPFEKATDAAMLQMVLNQSTGMDGASAISSHYRLEGAKQFLNILTTLGQPEREPVPERKLNHRI